MRIILINLVAILCLITAKKQLTIKYVSWNVHDTIDISDYSLYIVKTLLKLKQGFQPDIYAISLQEACKYCNYGQWYQIPQKFLYAIHSVTRVIYKLVGITATRRSNLCDSLYCLYMHGTSFMMILVKFQVRYDQKKFYRVHTCSAAFVGNEEKGMAIGTMRIGEKIFCFAGGHLDVSSRESRQKCIDQTLEFMVKTKCDVMLLGADYNTRVASKTSVYTSEFQSGRNLSYIMKMRETDEFRGSRPFSGTPNFLDYINITHGLSFDEPLNDFPNFIPTYSMNSSDQCDTHPVCYESDRHPAWTDRIMYYPSDLVNCMRYDIVRTLANYSDHIPIYADCEYNEN